VSPAAYGNAHAAFVQNTNCETDYISSDGLHPSSTGRERCVGARIEGARALLRRCPFCKRVEPTLQALQQKYGTKLKLVWRHFPSPFHKNAQLAAEAAEEVYSQQGSAGFWAFHDKLFGSDKDDSTRTERATLEQFARELGVNMNQFQTALDSHKHQAKVEADAALASKLGINGTPAFVINGYYLSGAQPEAAFRKLIELSLKGGPRVRVVP